jgi:hypothetical protein
MLTVIPVGNGFLLSIGRELVAFYGEKIKPGF